MNKEKILQRCFIIWMNISFFSGVIGAIFFLEHIVLFLLPMLITILIFTFALFIAVSIHIWFED